MKEKKCRTCVFWYFQTHIRDRRKPNVKIGECARYPKREIFSEDHFCGEHYYTRTIDNEEEVIMEDENVSE